MTDESTNELSYKKYKTSLRVLPDINPGDQSSQIGWVNHFYVI